MSETEQLSVEEVAAMTEDEWRPFHLRQLRETLSQIKALKVSADQAAKNNRELVTELERLRAENKTMRENCDKLERESMKRAASLKNTSDRLKVATDAMHHASRLCYARDIDGDLRHSEFSRHETYRVLQDALARISKMGGE